VHIQRQDLDCPKIHVESKVEKKHKIYWNIFYNFKVKCCRPLILFVVASIVCPPIVVVEIDSS
jgi:hypothetical protein